MAAVLAAFLITFGLCAALGVDPSAAVLAAVLALTMARKSERPTLSKTIARLIALPLVAVGAGVVGLVLHQAWIGAGPFLRVVLSIATPFGEPRHDRHHHRPAADASSTKPVHVVSGRGRMVDILLVMAAGLIAVLCTTVASAFGPRAAAAPVAPPRKADGERLPVSTRMALQMVVALAASFAIGLLWLPAHWPWIVLTAFIVCSGAVGRGDALYKGLQRLAGAIGGTVLAALIPHVAMPTPTIAAIVIFAILFLGMWLRTVNYAYWAVCATLLFALLQPPQSAAGLALSARLECILMARSRCSAWFVFRSRPAVVRLAWRPRSARSRLLARPDDRSRDGARANTTRVNSAGSHRRSNRIVGRAPGSGRIRPPIESARASLPRRLADGDEQGRGSHAPGDGASPSGARGHQCRCTAHANRRTRNALTRHDDGA